MADNDLTDQIEDIFSDTLPESETEEDTEDVSLLRDVVADLLDDEVVTEPGVAESAASEARRRASTQTEPVAGKKKDTSIVEEVVTGLFENDPETGRDVVGSAATEIPRHVMTKLEDEQQETRSTRASSLNAVSHGLFILLGLILVFILTGLIGSTLITGSVLGVLYVAGCVVALVIAVVQWRFRVSWVDAFREAEEEHAGALNTRMQFEERVRELNTANILLEKRASQFERVNQVLCALSPALKPDQLAQEVVNQVRDRFELLYVGLFLIDESGQWATLGASTLAGPPGQAGEVDHQMLSQGYRLEVGGGSLVGRCIGNAEALIGPGLDGETHHYSNTLLPDASSEMALPLQSDGRAVGALDLQNTQQQTFCQEDIRIFQRIADQLAIAIHNAQTFVELGARLEAAKESQRGDMRGKQSGLALSPVASFYERMQSGRTPLGGESLPEIEQAMSQRELFIADRTTDDKSHTTLVSPITLRGEVIGALGFHEDDARQWAADEIALIEDVATQVSLAVENVHLFEQTQMALEETDALYRASRAIASADSVDGILRSIVGSLTSPRVDQCFLGIFDSPGGKLSDDLVIVSSWSQEAEPLWQTGSQLSMNRDLMGERVRRDRPLILSDVTAESRLEGTIWDELVTAGISSLAVVPLVAVGGWIGVLTLAATQPGAITERNIQPYLTLAGQAALSIERSSLFKQTQEALEETSMLYRASRAIGAATSVSEVANVLLVSVSEGGFERGLVLVQGQEEDKLEVVAGWDRSGRPVEVGMQMDVDQVSLHLTIYSDLTQEDAPPNHRALDEVWRSWLTEGEGVELASIPILFRGSPLGVLLVESYRADQLNEKTLQPFVTLAAQAAVSFENRRLFDETRRAAEEEALLNEMLRRLATALDIHAIIQTVQDSLAQLVPFDHLALALTDEESSTLEVFNPGLEQPEGDRVPAKGQIVDLQETLVGRVINSRKTTVFDLTDSSLQGLEIEVMRQTGIQTCVIIPMVYGRDVLGSLSLGHSTSGAYATVDVPLLERVAQLAAIALENARLFGQLSQRAVQLQTAAQVSQAATSILSLDQLMAEAVELIRDRFGLYYVGLFMVDEADEWAVLRAGTGEAGRTQLEQEHRLEIGGDSMVGWCVANAKARVELDAGGEGKRFDNPILPDTQSELALPLISRGETIGALSVQSTFQAAFSREDITTLQTMADQLANAIQNARLFEQTQSALAETDILYRASAELNTAQSYEDILDALRQHTVVGQEAQRISLDLFDCPWTSSQMPEWIQILASWPQFSPGASSRYLLSDLPSAADLLRPDTPTIIEDVAGDPRLDDNARALLEQAGAKSILFAPLVVGGQWIGHINATYLEQTTFPKAEVRRLAAISGQAAVVVQGLRQLQEIQSRARREALIREITGKIRTSTDLETILQTTVTEMSRALGTSHGAIRLDTGNSAATEGDLESSEASPSSYSARDLEEKRKKPRELVTTGRGNGADAPGNQLQRGSPSPPHVGKGGQE